MSAPDPRIHKLFHHLRAATDLLEQMLLHGSSLPEKAREDVMKNARPTVANADETRPERLAYTLKEVQELVGISRSAIYLALTDGDLRAVKAGKRTLVLAKDLRSWLEKLPAKS